MTITIMPKIMHNTAKIGLETVTPIFLNPFSTTSVISCSSSYTFNYMGNLLIFKNIENSLGKMAVFKRLSSIIFFHTHLVYKERAYKLAKITI